jgi:hypothetical protein
MHLFVIRVNILILSLKCQKIKSFNSQLELFIEFDVNIFFSTDGKFILYYDFKVGYEKQFNVT